MGSMGASCSEAARGAGPAAETAIRVRVLEVENDFEVGMIIEVAAGRLTPGLVEEERAPEVELEVEPEVAGHAIEAVGETGTLYTCTVGVAVPMVLVGVTSIVVHCELGVVVVQLEAVVDPRMQSLSILSMTRRAVRAQ